MRRLLLSLVVLVFVAGACRSTSTEISADDPGALTPTPQSQATPGTDDVPDATDPGSNDPAPTDPQNPGGAEPRIVPPLELPTSAPGSDQAAEALLEELDRFLTEEQRNAGVPWPDLRNPDPVQAYRSSADFQQWMAENNPTPSLVEAYTAPGSPERGWDLEMFDFMNSFDLRSGPSDPPYSIRVEDLVHPAATGITDALLEQVPQGSAAVVYWDSVGPSDTFTADGQYWSSDLGWTDVGPWVAIMAPTDVGWQVWWDELTEPPPPGSRQNQGAPQEDVPRRDV